MDLSGYAQTQSGKNIHIAAFTQISIFHFTVEAHSYRKMYILSLACKKIVVGENIVLCQQSSLNVHFHGDLISCNCHSR